MRDLVYWECPHGDAAVTINGDELAALVPILDIAPFAAAADESLIPWLPDSWLNMAEAAVERHEEQHLEVRRG